MKGLPVAPEVLVFIIVLIVYFLASEGLRRYFEAKVEALYAAGLYDECFEFLNKLPARVLMTTFKQYYLRFMVHEARGEEEMATRMIEIMLRMRNSKKRQAALVVMAFNYFATIEDKKRAKELLVEVKQRCDKQVIQDCQLTYDIVFGRRHDYIEKMEQMLPRADKPLKAKLYFLLSKQYENAGDGKGARRYVELMKELDTPGSASANAS